MTNTLFHHISFDIVNHILQFHGKETYLDVRNNRHVRFTKAYISDHPLNQLQRVKAYKYIKIFIKKLKKQLKTVDLEEIRIKKSYHKYLAGFINRIKFIDQRYQNFRGHIHYSRNIKIPKLIVYPRQKRYIHVHYVKQTNISNIKCSICHQGSRFLFILQDDENDNYMQETLWF